MKKVLICLSSLFLLCSCAKEETVSDLINSSDALVESSNSSVKNKAVSSSSMVDSMVLIKPNKVTRIIPDDWKDKLSADDSKYSVGKMISGDNTWLCLIHFSDNLETSNVVECKNVTGS